MSGDLRKCALQIVLRRIEAGDTVRFVHDYYGGQWVEFQHRWKFWDKKRIQLEPAEIMAIKNELARARRRAQKAPTFARRLAAMIPV